MAFVALSGGLQGKVPIQSQSEREKIARIKGLSLLNLPAFAEKQGISLPTTTSTRKASSSSYAPSYGYEEGPSLYDQYLAQLEAERQRRVAAIKDSIRAQVEMSVNGYESQRPETKENYQTLKNQSELERYNQGRMLRESQANRGALDSGAGRQEQLAMQNNYGNALNSINQAEQKDLNALSRAIEDVRAQGRIQEALAEADAAGDFSTALAGGYENYANSANFANASSGIRKATRGGSAVSSSSGTGVDRGTSYINSLLLGRSPSQSTASRIQEIYRRKLNEDDLKRLGSTR
ncbi:MAG: hypothetical protein GX666_08245 [Tissierellia bacterium]|nr:hypothetical protein [Tissierellia bacterium]